MHRDLLDRKANRRNRCRPSNLTMTVAGVVVLLVLFAAWPFGYSEKTRSHKFKTLKAEQLRELAVRSDGSQADYFRRHILKPFLRVRVSGTKDNELVQRHIQSEMTSLGWQVDRDSFTDKTPLGQKTFTNIIATQNPSAPRRLILACHFDSKYFEQFEFIGATDSAVPCAMIIEIAQLLNSAFQTSKVKDVSLQLLFLDGEEAFVHWTSTDSIYGARHLAAQWEEEDQLKNIDAFILLDLIGTQSTTFRSFFPQTEKLYERLRKLEMRLANDGLLEPSRVFQGKRSNTYFSGATGYGGVEDDHIPFLRRNVPIVHLISAPFPSVWHQASDNESALNYVTINNIGKVLRAFVAEYLHLTV